jgi:hypothetical protein
MASYALIFPQRQTSRLGASGAGCAVQKCPPRLRQSVCLAMPTAATTTQTTIVIAADCSARGAA